MGSFVKNQFKQVWGQNNCKGGGKYYDAGRKLKIEDCFFKCLALGEERCRSVEFGSKNIDFQCRLWSGICRQNQDFTGYSQIYLKGTYNQFESNNDEIIVLAAVVILFILLLFCVICLLMYIVTKK